MAAALPVAALDGAGAVADTVAVACALPGSPDSAATAGVALAAPGVVVAGLLSTLVAVLWPLAAALLALAALVAPVVVGAAGAPVFADAVSAGAAGVCVAGALPEASPPGPPPEFAGGGFCAPTLAVPTSKWEN
jgi:hypothetical protein